MWTPLATVQFPTGSGGLGLDAFRRLREHRIVREHCWRDFRPELLKERRKDRKYILMDQKADSVADLATVLEWSKEENLTQKEKRFQQISEVDAAKHDEIYREKLAELTKLRTRARADGAIEKEKQKAIDARNGLRDRRTKRDERRELQMNLNLANLEINKLKRVKNATDARLMRMAERISTKAMRHMGTRAAARQGKTTDEYLVERKRKPAELDGVTVFWAREHDKEFAEKWPEWVRHDQMNVTRHSASISVTEGRSSWEQSSAEIHGPPETYLRSEEEALNAYALEPMEKDEASETSKSTQPTQQDAPPVATTKEREPAYKRMWPFSLMSSRNRDQQPKA